MNCAHQEKDSDGEQSNVSACWAEYPRNGLQQSRSATSNEVGVAAPKAINCSLGGICSAWNQCYQFASREGSFFLKMQCNVMQVLSKNFVRGVLIIVYLILKEAAGKNHNKHPGSKRTLLVISHYHECWEVPGLPRRLSRNLHPALQQHPLQAPVFCKHKYFIQSFLYEILSRSSCSPCSPDPAHFWNQKILYSFQKKEKKGKETVEMRRCLQELGSSKAGQHSGFRSAIWRI